MKKLKNYLSTNRFALIFFTFLFIFLLVLFHNAFKTKFILDDYVFAKISQANSISDLLYFLNPFKTHFYRPVPTEFFYYTLYLLKYNLILGHLIVFGTYFLGLVYLFRSLKVISRNEILSSLIVFLYSISLTHVFQLYIFNTFQEICMFTFLSISFYYYLTKRTFISSSFFLLALLSKETSILFPLFLGMYEIFKSRSIKIDYKRLIPFVALSLIFFILYKSGVSNVEQIPIYKVHLMPSLVMNNALWYSLWGIGFPNFLPDYMRSILFKPLPQFWNLLNSMDIRNYFYSLMFYIFLFAGVTSYTLSINRTKLFRIVSLFIFCILLFFMFISPTLFILHKWMVRLTISLVFLSIIQGYVMYLAFISKNKLLKASSIILIILFVYINFLGIKIHESSGLIGLETLIFDNTSQAFAENRDEIIKSQNIYIADKNGDWENGSQKLKVSFHDQDFLSYYFPGQKVKVIYEFETPIIPRGSFVIDSAKLTK